MWSLAPSFCVRKCRDQERIRVVRPARKGYTATHRDTALKLVVKSGGSVARQRIWILLSFAWGENWGSVAQQRIGMPLCFGRLKTVAMLHGSASGRTNASARVFFPNLGVSRTIHAHLPWSLKSHHILFKKTHVDCASLSGTTGAQQGRFAPREPRELSKRGAPAPPGA